jgi:hypothetical protein
MKAGRRLAVALCVGISGCCGSPAGTEQRPVVLQAECDRLSPVVSFRTDPDPGLWQEDANTSEILFSRVPRATSEHPDADELSLVLLKNDPRAPQEAVYMIRSRRQQMTPTYRVVHVRAKARIEAKATGVETEISEGTLDAELAHSLELVWGSMTLRARWPDRKESLARMGKVAGLLWRGGRYTFDYSLGNVRGQGETVSPERGTCAASLVGLGELLMQFTAASDPQRRRAIRDQLLKQSDALAERVNDPRARFSSVGAR